MPVANQDIHAKLRHVPSVDQLLRTDEARQLRGLVGITRLTNIARSVTEQMRTLVRVSDEILSTNVDLAEILLTEAVRRMEAIARFESDSNIRSIINATGVLLHTNLGRAPLSQAARHAVDRAARYCSVEYNIASGGRGGRAARVESLLKELTGAEDALVVNNCAAAALLILTVLARDGETIVSRGELVEIGGDFRVPDVMAGSGTRMVEVGTTNRTHLEDYKSSINSNTRLIMRVHPSNYRIVGFASSPTLAELTTLAHEAGLPIYEDAGSGQLSDLKTYGVVDEPIIRHEIETGVDVVSFSGDKLLGSAQAGLIVGKQAIVTQLRKHPLYRALRSDKLRLAALEATLLSHQKNLAADEVPVIQMLALTKGEIAQRAQTLVEEVGPTEATFELLDGESTVGGGAGATSTLPTTLIAISHPMKSAEEIEHALRTSETPIITRIANDKVLLDLRTVFPDELPSVTRSLEQIFPRHDAEPQT